MPPIDTTSKQAVVDAYRSYYMTSATAPLVWSGGSWDPARPGTINEDFRTDNLRRLNWFRAMAGLPGNVVFDAAFNAKCQAGALMISAANNFPGYGDIPSNWPAYSTDGADGCRNSNLSSGGTPGNGVSTIDGYFTESLDTAGHRWWLLRPGLVRSGLGVVPASNSLTPGDYRYNEGDTIWVASAGPTASPAPVVAWPPAGYFPLGVAFESGSNAQGASTGYVYQMAPRRWSVFLDAADFSNAVVTMKKNGAAIETAVTTRLPSGADSGIVWKLPAELVATEPSPLAKHGDVYDVTVAGVQAGGQSRTITYTVRMIDSNASKLINISTRLRVETGDSVGIAGFVVQGEKPRRVVIRALGPSLTAAGVAGALSNPSFRVMNAANELVAQNDDWQTQSPAARGAELQSLVGTGLEPRNPREAAVAITLQPGAYTAVVSGVGGEMGVSLIEVYDLDVPLVESRAVNVSTRGKVGTGDNVLIGGFVVGGSLGTGDSVVNSRFFSGTQRPSKVIVRALGPSLAAAGVTGVLSDPVLEIRDATGALVTSNWNFRADPAIPAGLVPTDAREVVVARTLMPGAYTAVVRGKNGATGVALVEAYEAQ